MEGHTRLLDLRAGGRCSVRRSICFGLILVCFLISVCIVVAATLYVMKGKDRPSTEQKSRLNNVQERRKSSRITHMPINKQVTSQSTERITTESTTEGSTAPPPRYPDCAEIREKVPETRGKSGVYQIYPDMTHAKNVSCDMVTDNGGWTVIQRRVDGQISFDRGWMEYKNGFGKADSEYWIGNDILHQMTFNKTQTLRVDLMRFSGATGYALYSRFEVESERNKYKLAVSGYSGTAGDGFYGSGTSGRLLNGMYFSTKDMDNDPDSSYNCAKSYNGGWWHNSCFKAFLNGPYLESPVDRRKASKSGRGIFWYVWGQRWDALKSVSMMIRPTSQ